MKKFVCYIIMAFAFAGAMSAQELQAKFKQFRNLCVESRTAYMNKDADRLADCVMRMYEMTKNQASPLSPWTRLKPEVEYERARYANHLLYDVEWMDSIVAELNQTDSLKIDVSSPMRGKGLLYVNYLIPANSTQTFATSGRGLMTIMVIAEDNTDIRLNVDQESCNHHYASSEKADNGCQYDVWQAGNTPLMTPYSIKVTNPSDHDVVCVFVTD